MTKSSNLQKLKGAPLDSKFQLGAVLGEGACGAVYEVLKVKSGKSSMTSFAAKVAILPTTTSSVSNNKKRKKTAEERNADLLSHEHVLYFNALSSLRGNMVPDIPLPGTSGPSSMGEFQYRNGSYRYVVMEKMQYPLNHLIPLLFQGKVLISDVFTRLIRLMQSIHGLHYVFVDVKPENFMLAADVNENNMTSSHIALKIRMIDVALIESSKDIMRNGKHRTDAYPDGQMVGTPTYASRNVMRGHTPSRRDDLEAIGYVILELMLLVSMNGDGQKSENNVLPWSMGKSDEDVLKRKVDAIEGKDHGAFWSFVTEQAGDVPTRIMKEYLLKVSSLEFKEQPDYEALVSLVQRLTMDMSTNKVKKRKRVKQSEQTSTKMPSRAKSLEVEDSKEFLESPRARRAAARDTRKGINLKNHSKDHEALEVNIKRSIDVIMKSPSPDKEETMEDMDWEAEKSTTLESKFTPSLNIECTSGPHKGEHRILQTSMLIGRNPKRGKGSLADSTFALKNDDTVSDNHTKIMLCSSGSKKGLLTVKVTDLKSSSGTFLNGKLLATGGYRQAFVNDSIQIGNSELRIKKP